MQSFPQLLPKVQNIDDRDGYDQRSRWLHDFMTVTLPAREEYCLCIRSLRVLYVAGPRATAKIFWRTIFFSAHFKFAVKLNTYIYIMQRITVTLWYLGREILSTATPHLILLPPSLIFS